MGNIAKIAEIAKESKFQHHPTQIPFSAIFGNLGIFGNCSIGAETLRSMTVCRSPAEFF